VCGRRRSAHALRWRLLFLRWRLLFLRLRRIRWRLLFLRLRRRCYHDVGIERACELVELLRRYFKLRHVRDASEGNPSVQI
jgi:hypothetical protein